MVSLLEHSIRMIENKPDGSSLEVDWSARENCCCNNFPFFTAVHHTFRDWREGAGHRISSDLLQLRHQLTKKLDLLQLRNQADYVEPVHRSVAQQAVT